MILLQKRSMEIHGISCNNALSLHFSLTNSHLYHYAGNNPVRYVDPEGRDITTVNFLGAGVMLIGGGNIAIGISWDDNNKVCLTYSASAGIGFVGDIDLPISPSVSISEGINFNDLNHFGILYFEGDASLKGLTTDVGIIFSGTIDMNDKKITGWSIGSIGGGVTFISGAVHIDLKEYYRIILNEIPSRIIETIKKYVNNHENIPDDVRQQINNVIPELER